MKLNIFLAIFLFSMSFCKDATEQDEVANAQNSLHQSNFSEKMDAIQYTTVGEIPCPAGFERIAIKEDSFDDFLRNFPVKQGDNRVYLYNGELKYNQNAQFCILDIDVGTRDLQQCADAVMRLRGEYLFAQKQYSQIHFNFLSDGKPRYFTDYAKGNYSKEKFRKYMDYIFSYANTASLKRELKSVTDLQSIRGGDVFIQQGNPYGHAITVMDVAVNKNTQEIIFLVSQSYMPAQDIHILKNPSNSKLSPWYELKMSGSVQTPEWLFEFSDLKRF